MGLRPGMRVLDVGCGVGGPAREIARFSDTHITGLNNNDFQINRARRYTEKAGLSNQVTFVKGDFMKLSEQFGENAFDAGTLFSFKKINARLTSIQSMQSKQPVTHQHGRVSMAKFSKS